MRGAQVPEATRQPPIFSVAGLKDLKKLFQHCRNFSVRATFRSLDETYPQPCERDTQMKNNQSDKLEGHGLPGPFGEIPRKLKEYYDSLQEQAIPDRFLDLLERLDHAERAAVDAARVEETE